MASSWMFVVGTLLAVAGADAVGAGTAMPLTTAGTRKMAAPGLDKTGTTGDRHARAELQAVELKELAIACSFRSERGGFEPPVRFDPHTAFPVPHNRPLCHLSRKLPLIYYNFIPGKRRWCGSGFGISCCRSGIRVGQWKRLRVCVHRNHLRAPGGFAQGAV